MFLEEENFELKEEILFLKGHLEDAEENAKSKSVQRTKNSIIEMIDSYDLEQKA